MSAVEVERRCPACNEALVAQRMPTGLAWDETYDEWHPTGEATYFIHRLGRPCPSGADEGQS